MHNKVGFIMILENYDVYNCEVSYVLKLICTMQLLLLVFVGSHKGISIILKKERFDLAKECVAFVISFVIW